MQPWRVRRGRLAGPVSSRGGRLFALGPTCAPRRDCDRAIRERRTPSREPSTLSHFGGSTPHPWERRGSRPGRSVRSDCEHASITRSQGRHGTLETTRLRQSCASACDARRGGRSTRSFEGADDVEAEACAPAERVASRSTVTEIARARALDRLAGWREGEKTGGVGDWASTGVRPVHSKRDRMRAIDTRRRLWCSSPLRLVSFSRSEPHPRPSWAPFLKRQPLFSEPRSEPSQPLATRRFPFSKARPAILAAKKSP
jgi:hypothetical protein